MTQQRRENPYNAYELGTAAQPADAETALLIELLTG